MDGRSVGRGEIEPPEGSWGRPSSALEVAVVDHTYSPLPEARVTVRRADRGGEDVTLPHDASRGHHRARLRPGRYLLRAEHGELEPQERPVEVRFGSETEVVVLGEKGMPYFYRRHGRVPFEPRPRLVAAELNDLRGSKERELLAQAAAAAGLQPHATAEQIERRGVVVFELPDTVGGSAARDAIDALERVPGVARAGQIVALDDQSVSYLTNGFVVCFATGVTAQEAAAVARALGVRVVRPIPYCQNSFEVVVDAPATYDLLTIGTTLAEHPVVDWAEPDLASTPVGDSIVPPDYLWPALWDRQLVDLPGAWQALQDAGLDTYGDPDLIIAVIDFGVESSGGIPVNPEFQGNVSNGAPKVYRYFDFAHMVANNDMPTDNVAHGDGAAGVASAKAANPSPVSGVAEGVVGAAPNCRIMPLIFPSTEVQQADMCIWAAGFDPHSPQPGFPAPIAPGADVITCSIGFGFNTGGLSGVARAALDFLTTYGRRGKGCLCFFSAGNSATDATTARPWAAYSKTFGIAASTLAADGATEIRASYSNYGPVKLCAPSSNGWVHDPPQSYTVWSTSGSASLIGWDARNLMGHPATVTSLTEPAEPGSGVLRVSSVAGFPAGEWLMLGTPGDPDVEILRVAGSPNPVTNEIQVTGGSSPLHPHPVGTAVIYGPNDYQHTFGQTSSATPLAAGVAALMLSANPGLTWVDALHVLRETSEKIDAGNTDPVGVWLDRNGVPATTSGQPPDFSRWYGHGRVDARAAVEGALGYAFTSDVIVRDNLSDGGSVPSGAPFWNSPDVWVRNDDPASEGAAALPSAYTVAGPHVAPVENTDNWVYVRVRNTLSETSRPFYVRVYIAHFPGLEFTYPESFLPSNRPGTAPMSPLPLGTYLIDEVAHPGLPGGGDDVVNVRWPASLVPPGPAPGVLWHPCLLVQVSPHTGPAPTGNHVWDYNDLAQKNVTVANVSTFPFWFAAGLIVGSPDLDEPELTLEIDRAGVPPGVDLFVDVLDPRWKKALRAQAAGVVPPGDWSAARLRAVPRRPLVSAATRGLALGFVDGEEVVVVQPKGKTRIPMRGGARGLTRIVLRGVVTDLGPDESTTVSVVQRDPSGRITGGAELQLRKAQV